MFCHFSLFGEYEINVNSTLLDGRCHGDIMVNVSGDEGPFLIELLAEGHTIEKITGPEGSYEFREFPEGPRYEIKITDNLGCETYNNIKIHCDCPSPQVKINAPSCHLNNGSISLLPELGEHFEVKWEHNGSTSSILSGIGIGTYCAEIKYIALLPFGVEPSESDLNYKCEMRICETIKECECEMKLNYSSINYWAESGNVKHPTSCNSNDGSIQIRSHHLSDFIENGAGPFIVEIYSVNQDAIIYTHNTEFDPSQINISGLSSGNYLINIYDSQGCFDRHYFVLEDNAFQILEHYIKHSCPGANNGEISIEPIGGVGDNFVVTWYYHGDNQYSDPNPSIVGMIDSDDFTISNLSPGWYSAHVTETNSGCRKKSAKFKIDDIDSLQPFEASISNLNHMCNGAGGGSVDINLEGGYPPYRIFINGIERTNPNRPLFDNTFDTYLNEGDNQIVIVDHCNEQIIITPPSIVECEFDAFCIPTNSDLGENNGSVQFYPDNCEGYTSLEYAFSDGYIEISDDDYHRDNLSTGNYSVTITNDLGCKVIKSFSIKTCNNDSSYPLLTDFGTPSTIKSDLHPHLNDCNEDGYFTFDFKEGYYYEFVSLPINNNGSPQGQPSSEFGFASGITTFNELPNNQYTLKVRKPEACNWITAFTQMFNCTCNSGHVGIIYPFNNLFNNSNPCESGQWEKDWIDNEVLRKWTIYDDAGNETYEYDETKIDFHVGNGVAVEVELEILTELGCIYKFYAAAGEEVDHCMSEGQLTFAELQNFTTDFSNGHDPELQVCYGKNVGFSCGSFSYINDYDVRRWNQFYFIPVEDSDPCGEGTLFVACNSGESLKISISSAETSYELYPYSAPADYPPFNGQNEEFDMRFNCPSTGTLCLFEEIFNGLGIVQTPLIVESCPQSDGTVDIPDIDPDCQPFRFTIASGGECGETVFLVSAGEDAFSDCNGSATFRLFEGVVDCTESNFNNTFPVINNDYEVTNISQPIVVDIDEPGVYTAMIYSEGNFLDCRTIICGDINGNCNPFGFEQISGNDCGLIGYEVTAGCTGEFQFGLFEGTIPCSPASFLSNTAIQEGTMSLTNGSAEFEVFVPETGDYTVMVFMEDGFYSCDNISCADDGTADCIFEYRHQNPTNQCHELFWDFNIQPPPLPNEFITFAFVPGDDCASQWNCNTGDLCENSSGCITFTASPELVGVSSTHRVYIPANIAAQIRGNQYCVKFKFRDKIRCYPHLLLCTEQVVSDTDCHETLEATNPGDGKTVIANSPLVVDENAQLAIILGPLSSNDEDAAFGVVSNVSNNIYDLSISEFNYQDRIHQEESLSHFSSNVGVHNLGGLKMQAGIIENVTHDWTWVYFPEPFATTPVIFATQITQNESTPTVVRMHSIDRSRFKIQLSEEQLEDGVHVGETLSYMAFEVGEGTIGDKSISVINTGRTVDHNWSDIDFSARSTFDNSPLVFAQVQTMFGADPAFVRYRNLTEGSVQVKLQEEQSKDMETAHIVESIGALFIESAGDCDCRINPIINVTPIWQNQPSCNFNDGEVRVVIEGGTAPFSYDMGQGLTPLTGELIINDISEGSTEIIIYDVNGCSYILNLTTGGYGLNLEKYRVFNEGCENDNFGILMTPQGGTPPFTYSWSTGSAESSIDNVGSGEYSVTVVDSEGCNGVQTFDLSHLSLYMHGSNSICTQSTGSINLTAYGTEPFLYYWSNGANTQDIENIPAGTYTVTVSDGAGCTAVETKVISETLFIDLLTESPFCGLNNGALTAVGEGNPPYSFVWSNGSVAESIENLSPGNYSVTVTDATGCSASKSIELVNNQTLSLNASGGNEGLSDGRYIPANTTLYWQFNPQAVSDALIISSDTQGDLVVTGPLTNLSSNCEGGINDCSSFYLGDFIGLDIDFSQGGTNGFISGVGSAFVTGPSTSYYCQDIPSSGGIEGSFTSGNTGSYISVTIEGSSCSNHSTVWGFSLSCDENTAAPLTESSIEDIELVQQTVSTNEVLDNEQQFDVFPNPTSDNLIVSNSAKKAKIEKLLLLDINGRVVFRNDVVDSYLHVINVKSFTSGVYLLKIRSGENEVIKRVLIN